MSVAIKQLPDLWEVAIEGDITLPCIAQVREAFLETLNGADHISLDLCYVSQVDISCLQVFCALHKTSITKGKEISFSGPVPSLVKETMERAGYYRDSGCRRKMSGECLLGGAVYE